MKKKYFWNLYLFFDFISAGSSWILFNYFRKTYIEKYDFEVNNKFKTVQSETLAPILYLIKYKNLQEAINIQNDVPQGLSSSIMTTKISEAEEFLSSAGSDCGIANVNIGT